MQEREWEFAKRLSDEELIATLTRCVKEDRDVTARLLVHLGEVDARGLFRDLGFSSMFDYAVQALHMSESEAGLRLRAARLGREFPSALAMVARGELHMTALKLLAPVLTTSSLDLLDQARFKSKLEIQKLIAARFPQPDVASVIRKLPAPRPASAPASSAGTPCVELASRRNASRPCGERARTPNRTRSGWSRPRLHHRPIIGCSRLLLPRHPPIAGPCPRSQSQLRATARCGIRSGRRATERPSLRAPAASAIVPLSQGRYKVQFTASQSLVDLFDEARDLLQTPTQNAELPSIVERALALLVAERKKQRFAQTRKPRAQRRSVSDAAADEVGPTARSTVAGFATSPTRRHGPCATSRRRRHASCTTSQRHRTLRARRAEASTPKTRHIPHAVRRQVYARDAGRCCFVSPEGTRCRARGVSSFTTSFRLHVGVRRRSTTSA